MAAESFQSIGAASTGGLVQGQCQAPRLQGPVEGQLLGVDEAGSASLAPNWPPVCLVYHQD